ncbi:MAG: hypothetical protein HXS48_00415 [Theionarchaea archaeon]|nr:MAG: hypothetical protein AYK19_19415 [Theionarchaea archaeon DG-70-1]MBU7025374.1 hypothetical protein [Theionarchaea archaeon]
MPVIGIRMDKIEAERKENIKVEGQMRILPVPRILQVQETQIPGPTGRVNIVEVSFEYLTNYDPPVGEIKVSGTIMFQEAENIRKQLVDTWKEKRQLHPDIGKEIIYRMTQQGFLVMMNLARELNLPSPMPLRIQAQGEEPVS